MPDDFDFRSLFTTVETDAPPIDTKRVIRRARARRLPAQLAVGAGAVVVTGMIVTAGIFGLQSLSTHSSASSASVAEAPERAPIVAPSTSSLDAEGQTASGATSDTGDKRAPADKLNLCGGSLAEVAPSATGLVVTPHFPDASAEAASVTGTVTLTNTSDATVTSETSEAPSITLSKDGIVLWHSSNLPLSNRAIDLGPGESMEFPVSFSPVTCGVEDDTDGFRADLPHVAPGEYRVSAAMGVLSDELSDLVTGPTKTVTLK